MTKINIINPHLQLLIGSETFSKTMYKKLNLPLAS